MKTYSGDPEGQPMGPPTEKHYGGGEIAGTG